MTTQQRTVSIVMPIRGAEATLQRALDSVERMGEAAPAGWDVELVAVLDGLVDGCDSILADWQPRSVRLVTTAQEHRGISAARNAAVDRLSGDVVTFLDADDEICPARWSAIVRVAGTDLVIMGTQEYVVAEGCRIPGADPVTGILTEGPDYYFMGMSLDARLLRRAGAFDETYVAGGDGEYVYRMRRMGVQIEMVEQCFTIRHIHGANLTSDETLLVGGLIRAVREHRRAMQAAEPGGPGRLEGP
jgi:glycosyltransferase involved in cell wall biosynthesis